MSNTTAKGRFLALESKRSEVFRRAVDCAQLTIPALFPESGHNENSPLPTPYQGIGARGTNNLASKLLLALFPPNSVFFRLTPVPEVKAELDEAGVDLAEIEKKLAAYERKGAELLETANARSVLYEALRQLIVVGDCTLHRMYSGAMRLYKLSQYVTERDGEGTVIEQVIKESVSPTTLDEAVKAACNVDSESSEDTEIYTHITFKDKKYSLYQEINGVRVPDTETTFSKDSNPFITLQWTSIPGENYGRSHVAEYLGDLRSHEALSKAIISGAAAAAKVIFLLKPGSLRQKTLAEAETGDIITGDINEVDALQVNKFSDFRVAKETLDDIGERLSYAFMLNSVAQRQGERVTAEEIRYVAKELEDTLGGVYSLLSHTLQLPLVKLLMRDIRKSGELSPLPKGVVKPQITTGLEALGRGNDLNKLTQLIQQLQPLGKEVVAQYINISDYITRSATSLGIDTTGLVKTEEQMAQERQQALMAQVGQQTAPGAIQELIKQNGANSPDQGDS